MSELYFSHSALHYSANHYIKLCIIHRFTTAGIYAGKHAGRQHHIYKVLYFVYRNIYIWITLQCYSLCWGLTSTWPLPELDLHDARLKLTLYDALPTVHEQLNICSKTFSTASCEITFSPESSLYELQTGWGSSVTWSIKYWCYELWHNSRGRSVVFTRPTFIITTSLHLKWN